MPELPEVETLRRQLQGSLVGRTIRGVWLDHSPPPFLRKLSPAEFAEAVCGRTITGVSRSGKWLIAGLEGGHALVIHLRMTGRLLLRRPEDPADPYLRARLELDDGSELRWCDVRKFGTWDLVADPVEATGVVGPEPLDERFSAQAILAAAAGRRAPIKAFLLDQRRVAGLGNIYADEALWAAGIHPLRPAGTLSQAEACRLRAAIVAVLHDSLDSGGSSMRDYLDTAGRAGRFQERWQVYKREGQPCTRCATPIVKLAVGGRGTRFCPCCQPALAGAAQPPGVENPREP